MSRRFYPALFLLVLATPLDAGNGGLVDGHGAPENKKWSYDDGSRPVVAPGDLSIPEDKKYRTSAEDPYSEPDYEARGARNAINGTLTMWGKLIANALPSNEPLPEKKKPGEKK